MDDGTFREQYACHFTARRKPARLVPLVSIC